jgi:murein DD-endopeptidase MepM/ murein hydrolase activator NlpD
MDGVVSSAAYDPKFGCFIRISHCAGIESIYGHLSLIGVAPGDSVNCGQPIGLSGNSGEVTAGHLHFAIRCNGQNTDPLKFLYQSILLNSNEHE